MLVDPGRISGKAGYPVVAASHQQPVDLGMPLEARKHRLQPAGADLASQASARGHPDDGILREAQFFAASGIRGYFEMKAPAVDHLLPDADLRCPTRARRFTRGEPDIE